MEHVIRFTFQLSELTGPGDSAAREMIGAYDPVFVLISIVVGIFAAYSALLITDHLVSVSDYPNPRRWLVAGACVMGCGIWAMHFIGMSAFRLPVDVAYDPMITLISVVPAILASGIALQVIRQPKLVLARAHLGGALMGLGIGTMHYTGMAAMQLNGLMVYDPVWFAGSIVVAYALSTASFHTWFRLRSSMTLDSRVINGLCAAVLGGAISAMHYMGMAAAHYYEIEGGIRLTGIDPTGLALPLLLATLFVIAMLVGALGLQRELFTARMTIERLIEMSPDSLVAIDSRARIRNVNRQTEATFGYEREELIGRPIQMLLPEEFHPAFEDAFAAFHADPQRRDNPVEFAIGGVRKDGRRIPTEVIINYEVAGGEIFITASIRDITERKKEERERKQLEDQLLQAQKMEAVGRLAGGIAHDFNNILAGIAGYAELVKSSLSQDDPNRQDLDAIADLVRRAASLTNQLLMFSKHGGVEIEVFDLRDQVKRIDSLVQHLIRREINLEIDAGSEPNFMEGSRGQVEQVLLNLVINAADAIEGKGTIRIVVRAIELTAEDVKPLDIAPGPWTSLRVEDTGHGIPEEVRQYIFEPFYSTRQLGKGSGLGLSVVFGVVQQMQGKINVKNRAGGGTIMEILLPRTEGTGVTVAPDQVERPDQDDSGKERILVAEDEASVRDFVVKVLTRKGYDVVQGENGEEALAKLVEVGGDVDLVLSDIMMPRMSGKEFAEKAREHYPDIKFLFMTGYQTDPMDTPVMSKPFTVTELLTRIRTSIDGDGVDGNEVSVTRI